MLSSQCFLSKQSSSPQPMFAGVLVVVLCDDGFGTDYQSAAC